MPTLLTQAMEASGMFDCDLTLLVATGDEVRLESGRWREFRRCGKEEFEVVFRKWERAVHAGGPPAPLGSR